MQLLLKAGTVLAALAVLQAAEVRSLDGPWKIAKDPANAGKQARWYSAPVLPGARDCRVPDILEQTFPGYDGVVWYAKVFEVPRIQPKERLRLRFHAADYLAEAWLNGEYLGAHEGGETPFSFDITRIAKPGAPNRLTVRLLNPGQQRIDGMVLDETPHGIKSAPMTVGNFWNPGGLWQSVDLLRVPAVRIGDLQVNAEREAQKVVARVRVSNDTRQEVSGRLLIEIAPAAGGAVIQRKSQAVNVAANGGEFEVEAMLAEAHSWSPDDPYLYRVTARLETAGTSDTESTRTGFSDFVFRDGYFRLNGRRIFLKGTHSVGHFPIGQHVPADPELLRRELIYVKAMGFNMVRWLGRTMFPSQLDLCDELGLMVYEESYASWRWRDSPDMKRRFDSAVQEMILRDRNHPSLVIWGLLNETVANPVFRHAVEMLPLIRKADPSRMVLLSSGRWDGQWSIGSISNPNTTEWLPALGAEAAGAAPVEQKHPGGYTQGAGDAHMYVPRPWRAEDLRFFRTTGTGMKNVFVSEYGNGSQIDPIRIVRLMEQNGASEDLDDFRFYRAMSQQFERDWKRWGLETVFASPSEMISAGQRLQTEQRRLALNAIRSNPHLAGYSLTGLSDQAIEGEGLMTTFRELKPGIVDVMTEGFAPVKWCLFADPVHAYRGGTVRVEAVLANEDALRAGTYPVRLRVLGPAGVAYEKRSEITIPDPQSKPEPAMVFPAFDEAVKLAGPAGRYTVEVSIEHGAAATARETILLGDRDLLPAANASVLWLGSSGAGSKFLAGHGAKVSAFPSGGGEQRNVIVVAKDAAESSDAWIRQVRAGSVAILLEPSRLPEGLKGKLDHSAPYFWGRDDIVKPHAIFEGLPSGSLMDLLFYRDLIARDSVTDFDERAENLIPTFALGRPGGQGYWAGSNLLIYSLGEGKVIVSTLRLEENLGRHPAADRLFLNLVTFAAKNLGRSSSSAIQPIRIPMRDGVYLAADLYRAAGGGKAPVLLMRTPYNKATAGGTAVKYAAAGYHVVVQDTRGRYESEGSFYPYNSEGQDGYDTLEWIRRQPWADGRVGMWGASYVGAVQWQAAAEHAPGLAVLAPTATWSSFYRNVYLGGTVRLGLVAQAAASLERPRTGPPAGMVDWSRVLLHLPLADMDRAIGWRMPWLTGILTHNRPDGFWKRLDLTEDAASLRIPVQHVVGYYDFFSREVVANFQRLRSRTVEQLILGPWDHGTIGKTRVGDVDFGPNARLDLAAENLSWFNRFLKGSTGDFPQVRYFSMGDNTWKASADWPPPNASSTWFYLHSQGNANTRQGGGRLSRQEPGSEPADVFESDPANPVPAVPAGNGHAIFETAWGPVDQGVNEDRPDVLVYTTEVLRKPLRFAGPLRAELNIHSSTIDSDWVVKLIDVRPDGFAQNLATGIQRAGYFESPLEFRPLVPGRRYKISVDMGHAAAAVLPGHRLRVEVAGSCFPLYDRNTNTGAGPRGERVLVSHQRLEHSAGAASGVLLPVIEGEAE